MTTYQSPSTAIPVGSPYQSAFPVVQNISAAQLECFSLRRTVKILCGIDIFFGLLYSFYNPYFYNTYSNCGGRILWCKTL